MEQLLLTEPLGLRPIRLLVIAANPVVYFIGVFEVIPDRSSKLIVREFHERRHVLGGALDGVLAAERLAPEQLREHPHLGAVCKCGTTPGRTIAKDDTGMPLHAALLFGP